MGERRSFPLGNSRFNPSIHDLQSTSFSCVSCGYSAPADTNAAVNIAARAAVNRPNGLDPLMGQGQSRRI